MTEEIRKLKGIIDGSDNIVFFGRSRRLDRAASPTSAAWTDSTASSGATRRNDPEPPTTNAIPKFFAFYRAKLLCPDTKPNAAHRKLAEWERAGKLKGRHHAEHRRTPSGRRQQPGEAFELHGSTLRSTARCGKFYGVEASARSTGVPTCSCGGRIKPDVVLCEEGLNEDTLYKAVRYIAEADVLIIAGTSLAVYPAAGLVNYSRPQARRHQQDAAER